MLSDQLSVLVDLTGIIDVETEVGRLKKEIERLQPMVESYRRKIATAGILREVYECMYVCLWLHACKCVIVLTLVYMYVCIYLYFLNKKYICMYVYM